MPVAAEIVSTRLALVPRCCQVELKNSAQEHDEIKSEIDELYERLFGGPTPGFPEEDVAEEAFKSAKAENDVTKERIRRSREALRLLNLAQERLPQAQKYMASAQKLGKEMWLFVGKPHSHNIFLFPSTRAQVLRHQGSQTELLLQAFGSPI